MSMYNVITTALLFVISFLLGANSQVPVYPNAPNASSEAALHSGCTVNETNPMLSDCTAVDVNSECIVTNATTDPVERSCFCREPWIHYNAACISFPILEEKCDKNSTAENWLANAECRYDGTGGGTWRYLCKIGFVKVDDETPGVHRCDHVIQTNIDESCMKCEENEGTCHSKDGSTKSGCVCPTSRSGVECEKIHVNVTCDHDKFKMRICYDPHEGINFTTGSAMFSMDHQRIDACNAHAYNSSDDDPCVEGQMALALDLDPKFRDTCGTTYFRSTPTTMKYMNAIVVQKGEKKSTKGEDIKFRAYCSFDTHTFASFQPIGSVGIVAGNDRGQHNKPKLTLQVLNLQREVIPYNVAQKLNDKMLFTVMLNVEDSSYRALRVEFCTASSSSVLGDPSEIFIPLIIDGCPNPAQSHITNNNNWHVIAGKPNWLQTGFVRVFRVGDSNYVFVHCTFKLCLKGDEHKCKPKECTGRRKRSLDESEDGDLGTATVSRKLIWYSDKTATSRGGIEMSVGGFVALISVLVIILIIFLVVCILLALRTRNQKGKVQDEQENGASHPPRRFAMPRLNRTAVRT